MSLAGHLHVRFLQSAFPCLLVSSLTVLDLAPSISWPRLDLNPVKQLCDSVLLLFLFEQQTVAMLLLVSVHFIFISFVCCPLFLPPVFFFHRMSAFIVLALVFLPGLYFADYRNLPFLPSLLRRMFFLPYANYVVVSGCSAFAFVVFVSCLFLFYYFCLFRVRSWRRYILLATSLPVSTSMLSLLFFLRQSSGLDLVWVRLFCDHGLIRSGSVNVK